MPLAVGYLGFDPNLGAHSFQLDDGTSLLSPDLPEARRLAATLPALSGPQPMAQNTPIGPDTAIDARPELPPSIADVPQASGATGEEPGVMRTGGMRAGLNVVNPPKLPSLQKTAGVSPPATGGGLLTPEEEALGTKIPAAGYVSLEQAQQQLQKKSGMGVLMPSGQEITTTGAHPVPGWIAEEQARARLAQRAAHVAVAESQIEDANTNILAQRNQQEYLQNEWQKAMMHQRYQEWEAQQKVDAVKQFDQDAQARYADFGPERLFKRKGTWATIGAAIAQGLGAYAAIVSGTGRNYAQEIVNNAIDRDVQSQREEYLRDRDARNNLVAELARSTGDLETATKGAGLIMQNLAHAHAEELAGLSKKTEIANNFALWDADWQAAQADRLEALSNAAQGQVTLKTTGTFKYPQAVGGPLTEEQKLKRIERIEGLKTGIAKHRSERGELSPGGPGQLGPNDITPGVRAAGGKEEAAKARTQLADIDAADAALAELEKATAKAGVIEKKIGGKQNPFTGNPLSEGGAELETQRSIATGALSQLAGSGVVNPGEYPRLKENVSSVAGIRGARSVLAAKKKAIIQTHARLGSAAEGPKEKE